MQGDWDDCDGWINGDWGDQDKWDDQDDLLGLLGRFGGLEWFKNKSCIHLIGSQDSKQIHV